MMLIARDASVLVCYHRRCVWPPVALDYDVLNAFTVSLWFGNLFLWPILYSTLTKFNFDLWRDSKSIELEFWKLTVYTVFCFVRLSSARHDFLSLTIGWTKCQHYLPKWAVWKQEYVLNFVIGFEASKCLVSFVLCWMVSASTQRLVTDERIGTD